MAFRPQFLYEDEGYQDYMATFAAFNTPAFSGNLAAGAARANIPLNLDPDGPFKLRGIKVINPIAGLAVRLRDAFGNYLSDDANPTQLDLTYAPSSIAFLASMPVPIETESQSPRGATLWVDLVNTLGAPASIAGLQICLMGVKRYAE